jgi:hypothetical protein
MEDPRNSTADLHVTPFTEYLSSCDSKVKMTDSSHGSVTVALSCQLSALHILSTGYRWPCLVAWA